MANVCSLADVHSLANVYSLEKAQDLRIFDDAALVFGVFDGFHLGHRYLVDGCLRRAQMDGVPSVALTFDIDPDELFRPSALKKLCTNETRIRLLAESGVDSVVLLPFTREFAALDPVSFLERTFWRGYPSSLHVGSDFRFGCKGAGGVSDLRLWAERTGTDIIAYNLETYHDEPVTATRVRGLLAQGAVAEAAQLLGRPWRMEGVVEAGRGEGADMGFATANLVVDPMHQAVADGVYAAYAVIDGERYKAAVSVGVTPTFENATATCEVHILDFSRDIYGCNIAVDFVEWLRPMMKFDSVEVLIATVMGNIDWVRQNL